MEQEFHKSVDTYIAFCEELGESPEKPYAGKILFRTTPARHQQIARAAHRAGMSVNAWMEAVLTEEVSSQTPSAMRPSRVRRTPRGKEASA